MDPKEMPKEVMEEPWEEFWIDKKPDSPEKRQKKLIASIVGLSIAILLVIIGIVIFFVLRQSNYSFDVQFDAGKDYWNKGNYEKAIIAYEKAINAAKNDKNHIAASRELAKLYIERGKNSDKSNAIYYLESVIDLNSQDINSIKMLVQLYEERNEADAIRKIAKKASSDKTSSLFEKYLLNQPVFNYKSGTYNELLTVEITSADEEAIYYTLDDTKATVESTPYAGMIEIGEGTYVIHAITINKNGLVSEEIVVTYIVKLDTPPNPIITPESGIYSENFQIAITNIPTNCTVHYTLDDSAPTVESEEYREPFNMPLGNYVISAISVNQYNGLTSGVVSKVFELKGSGKVPWTEAPAKVMNRLLQLGEVADAHGTMPDGSICTLVTQEICKIGNSTYYIVKRYKSQGNSLSEHDSEYAVDSNTGDVYTAIPNGTRNYNLGAT